MDVRLLLPDGSIRVYRLQGDAFKVPGNSSFDIRVTEAFHYICHYG